MTSYRPKIAQIKITHQDETRLVVDYHPLAYLLAGTAFALACFWVGVRYAGNPDSPGWIAMLFGVIFFAAFGLLFYRRMVLTFDRSTGQITHYKRTLLIRRRSRAYKLGSFTGVAVQTRTQGDGKWVFQRALLQFSDQEPVPMTLAMITGGSPGDVAEAINAWAGTEGRYAD